MQNNLVQTAKSGLFLINAALVSVAATASTALNEVHLSSNIHTRVLSSGGGGLVISDDEIAVYDIAAGQVSSNAELGALDRSDVDAYHAADPCGPALYSLNNTAEIGGTVMRPADVFTTNGIKIFDAVDEGVADGAGVDAVALEPASCELILSFDVTVELDGTVFRPDDLMRFVGGTFSMFREGPGAGNLDAVHVLDIGSVLASFAAPVPDLGIALTDQDVVEQSQPGGAWELAFEPAPLDTSWESADTDALYAVRAPIPGSFAWQNPNIDVLEEQGSFTVAVQRFGQAEGPVNVGYSTADGTALAGIDYEGASGSVVFADGELVDTASFTLIDDGVLDGDKTLFIDLTSATNGGALTSPTRIAVRIRDDEDFLFADGFES